MDFPMSYSICISYEIGNMDQLQEINQSATCQYLVWVAMYSRSERRSRLYWDFPMSILTSQQ